MAILQLSDHHAGGLGLVYDPIQPAYNQSRPDGRLKLTAIDRAHGSVSRYSTLVTRWQHRYLDTSPQYQQASTACTVLAGALCTLGFGTTSCDAGLRTGSAKCTQSNVGEKILNAKKVEKWKESIRNLICERHSSHVNHNDNYNYSN